MKKLLITVCLSGLLSVPSAVLGAEMAGPSLYGSFRTGLNFGSGDAEVTNYSSRWGFKGSVEVSEGLTASYKYETNINTTNAESGGGVGHAHDKFIDLGNAHSTNDDHVALFESTPNVYDDDDDATTPEITIPDDVEGAGFTNKCGRGDPFAITLDDDKNNVYTAIDEFTETDLTMGDDRITCGNLINTDDDGGTGGRQSYISLSGGFGTITVGRIWSASYNHYGAALDPTWFKGSGGADSATYTIGNVVSYSSSAGDVSFQIDRVTGDDAALQIGATAALGPVGVGFGYRSSDSDKSGFTGVALSTGAGGIGLAVGLGSEDDADGVGSDTSLLSVSGALGDSGVSYGVQVASSDNDDLDQTLISLVNTLGPGVAIHFEHLDPGAKDSSSHLVLRVDF